MPAIKLQNEKDPKTGLPPAGHERNEELLRRTDALTEQAETRMPDAHTISSDALTPDRELQHIMQEFSLHEVTNKQPNFHYSWVFSGHHGTEITMKRSYGWVVVQGNDPESTELQSVDTTRRLGDCILMRIPLERYHKLQKYEEYVRKMRLGSGDEEVKELGRQLGLNVSTDDPSIIKRFGGNTPAQMVVTQGPLDKMIRKGTVPGLEAGT
jgi:hypothetical protein